MSAHFGEVSDDDIARLIDRHPLGWIIARGDPARATPMPMLLERDADGRPQSLLGHLPKRHPLVPAFQADPAGVFLFQGPHGYITPEWLADKDWAPTWNFAVATIEAGVTIDDDLTDAALQQLVAHMERERIAPWTTDAMGARYATLRERVVGFRATITRWRARFKLGQDESDPAFAQIVAGLGDTELTRWMIAAR